MEKRMLDDRLGATSKVLVYYFDRLTTSYQQVVLYSDLNVPLAKPRRASLFLKQQEKNK